ncbi:hypothetical protein [Brytella acorum]|uniref:Uncharacterized protein n=1 Tax=Brytella acorum TaxID=2959299 RepID=A0AA35UXL2_9PROT|nr:hypothetical protein [Brytella acorum]MDF3625710.1 hypothetical protein [Brytella acorum]CAI9121339.1 hypothetical protein LMG32879_002186 [Brytella acorum]
MDGRDDAAERLARGEWVSLLDAFDVVTSAELRAEMAAVISDAERFRGIGAVWAAIRASRWAGYAATIGSNVPSRISYPRNSSIEAQKAVFARWQAVFAKIEEHLRGCLQSGDFVARSYPAAGVGAWDDVPAPSWRIYRFLWVSTDNAAAWFDGVRVRCDPKGPTLTPLDYFEIRRVSTVFPAVAVDSRDGLPVTAEHTAGVAKSNTRVGQDEIIGKLLSSDGVGEKTKDEFFGMAQEFWSGLSRNYFDTRLWKEIKGAAKVRGITLLGRGRPPKK